VTGPIQVLVVGFDQLTFSGDVMAELDRLREAGTARLIDVLLVERGEDGTLETLPAPAGAPAWLRPSRRELPAASARDSCRALVSFPSLLRGISSARI